MHKEKDIDDILSKLEQKAGYLKTCLQLLMAEENDTNDECAIKAWNVIMTKYSSEIHSLLIRIKENIQWSFLNDRKVELRKIKINYANVFSTYKEYLGSEYNNMFNSIISLLDEGANGFRQPMLVDGYHEELLKKHLDDYRESNKERLTDIYNQDSADKVFKYPDDNQRKAFLLDDRRDQLFADKIGKLFHDHRRIIKPFVIAIIDDNGTNYTETDIYSFLDKYLAYIIAEEFCNKKEEKITFKNIIFKENVDVDKVIKKLNEYVDNKLIKAQRHWYIVYRVFLNKKWLSKQTHTKFIEQINYIFENKLKYTCYDSKEIPSYFKNKEKSYLDWTLDDIEAPQNCDEFKDIAKTLHDEFTDEKYAKPGKVINTRKIEKF